MKRVAVLVVAGIGLGWLLRGRLVDLLTATTGTWVGSPPPTKATQ